MGLVMENQRKLGLCMGFSGWSGAGVTEWLHGLG